MTKEKHQDNLKRLREIIIKEFPNYEINQEHLEFVDYNKEVNILIRLKAEYDE